MAAVAPARILRLVVLGIALAGSALPARAVNPDEMLSDPALEARARGLSAALRCLVCQNQSIDDSDAPLARDLRLLVRERLTKGDNDEQVKSFIVARYGEFVLLKPPLEGKTLVLWVAPFLLLAIAAAAAGGTYWRMRGAAGVRSAPAATLTAAEEAQLARLLGEQPNADK